MLTFFLYILPVSIVLFCQIFYIKHVDKDKTSVFIPRLARIILLLFSFIPIIGWLCAGIWIYIFCSYETKFKPNKLTNFFIEN